MPKSILIAAAATAELKPSPISPDWIIGGKPETRSRELARSRDRTSYAMVWDCTAGEAFITYEQGEERRIGPGDIVFFPAGTSAKWRVPSYIRKVAFLRHTMPRPMGLGVLAWNLMLRTIFRNGGSGL